MMKLILCLFPFFAIPDLVNGEVPMQPDWYLSDDFDKSCDEVCAANNGGPCNVAGNNQLTSSNIGDVLEDQFGFTDCKAESTGFGPVIQSSGVCLAKQNGISDYACSQGGFGQNQRICCCAADIADCPLPTAAPTASPTSTPTTSPTSAPTAMPTASPTSAPTAMPTASPTSAPTDMPTTTPTSSPTATPTSSSTPMPTSMPTTACEQVCGFNDGGIPMTRTTIFGRCREICVLPLFVGIQQVLGYTCGTCP